MNHHYTKPFQIVMFANNVICAALFLCIESSHAQSTILSSYGQGGQDAGIDVIGWSYYSYPITMEWAQSVAFSDVSISVGVGSFGTPATGWAILSTPNGQLASTFDYPYANGYASVNLWDGLNLPQGEYALTLGSDSGSYSGADDGWAVPVAGTLYTDPNASYLGTWNYESSYIYNPPDFAIVSVPEPATATVFGLGLCLIAGLRLREKRIGKSCHV
jgi:hypothetical protein